MAQQKLQAIKEVRIEKIAKLRALGINPYPSSIELSGDLLTTKEASEKLDSEVLTAGRVWSIREHGAVAFLDITDEMGKIQALFQKKSLGDKFNLFELLDIGDFLAVKGKVIKTEAG